LRLLDDELAAMRAHQGLELLASASNNHHHPLRMQLADTAKHMAKHRQPGNRVEDLVQIGLHPGTLACGKDHGGEWLGRHH
jgi:hypothetical protein